MRLPSSRAALALALTMSFAACDDEVGPRSPSTPDTPTATESSSPTEPTTTSTGDASDQRGPVAVVRAWVAAFNETLRGGDPATAAELTTASCWTCNEHIDPVVRTLEKGGWYRGGGWSVTRARVADKSEITASVYAAIAAASGTTLTRAGSEPIAYEEDKFILDVRLKSSRAGWRIAKIVYLS